MRVNPIRIVEAPRRRGAEGQGGRGAPVRLSPAPEPSRPSAPLRPCALALCAFLAGGPALAAPPTLEPPPGEAMPVSVQVGQTRIFRMIYRDPDDDRPRSVTLVLEKPSGTARLPG